MHPTLKAPDFESGNANIGIKKLANENLILYSKKADVNDIKVDFAGGKASVSMVTQPYSPELVYRAILKMAMAVLPVEDVANYRIGFKFLLNPTQYPDLFKFKSAIVTETQIVLAQPFALLFRKKSHCNLVNGSEFIFCLYTNFLMFQISLRSYKGEENLPDFTPINLAAPYIQLNTLETHDNIIIKRSIQDLNSTKKIKRDVSLHTEFSVENLVGVDVGKDFLEELIKKAKKAIAL